MEHIKISNVVSSSTKNSADYISSSEQKGRPRMPVPAKWLPVPAYLKFDKKTHDFVNIVPDKGFISSLFPIPLPYYQSYRSEIRRNFDTIITQFPPLKSNNITENTESQVRLRFLHSRHLIDSEHCQYTSKFCNKLRSLNANIDLYANKLIRLQTKDNNLKNHKSSSLSHLVQPKHSQPLHPPITSTFKEKLATTTNSDNDLDIED